MKTKLPVILSEAKDPKLAAPQSSLGSFGAAAPQDDGERVVTQNGVVEAQEPFARHPERSEGSQTRSAAIESRVLRAPGPQDDGSRGVDIAKSCITAEAALPRDPSAAIELFGFREFSYVFDIAGRCAAGLAALVAGARWEQRLWALMPQASISHGWSAAVNESRWALEDARSRAQEAMFALHWQRDLQLLDVKASTNDALLRQIVHRCRASERSVVVWGAGAAGRRVLNLVLDVGGVIDAFVDSNVAKHGTSVAGRPVIAPQMLFSSEWLGSFVLIGSMHAAEIEVDRKVLADLAVTDPAAFTALVEKARAAVA